MQDRYAGDIGDFAKYALLNALVGSDLRLGVVWYLNPDEEGNADGGFTEYPELQDCDKSLYDRIQPFRDPLNRSVAGIQSARLLPLGTVFFADPLSFKSVSPSDRAQLREQWLDRAEVAIGHADVVFLDPDNGFASRLASPTTRKAQKYVFLDEVKRFLSRDQSVVIYHHHARYEKLPAQVERHLQELRNAGAHQPWAFTFHRKSVRAFFIAAAGRHSGLLLDRSREFMRTMWGEREHFKWREPAV